MLVTGVVGPLDVSNLRPTPVPGDQLCIVLVAICIQSETICQASLLQRIVLACQSPPSWRRSSPRGRCSRRRCPPAWRSRCSSPSPAWTGARHRRRSCSHSCNTSDRTLRGNQKEKEWNEEIHRTSVYHHGHNEDVDQLGHFVGGLAVSDIK